MRLLQYEVRGERRLGAEVSGGEGIVDLSTANSSIPNDMRSFINGGAKMEQVAER